MRNLSPDFFGQPLTEVAPEIARTAPRTTTVRRLDEAGAARNPIIRQEVRQ